MTRNLKVWYMILRIVINTLSHAPFVCLSASMSPLFMFIIDNKARIATGKMACLELGGAHLCKKCKQEWEHRCEY